MEKILLDKLDYIDEITKDEVKWKEFLDKLTLYVQNLRKQLIEIIHENNSYFDYIITKNEIKTPSLL